MDTRKCDRCWEYFDVQTHPSHLPDNFCYTCYTWILGDTYRHFGEFNTPTPTLEDTMEVLKHEIAEFEKTLSPEEAAILKQTRNERRTVRAQITKAVNKLDAALTSADKFAVKRIVAELTKIQEKLSLKDEDVWALMSDKCVLADQAMVVSRVRAVM